MVVRTDDFVQFFCTHGAPLRAKNSAMTKPRYSENILPVPWSFVLIYRRSTGTVEMYYAFASGLVTEKRSLKL